MRRLSWVVVAGVLCTPALSHADVLLAGYVGA